MGEYHVVSESLARSRKRTSGKSLFTIPTEKSSSWWNLLVIYRGAEGKSIEGDFQTGSGNTTVTARTMIVTFTKH